MRCAVRWHCGTASQSVATACATAENISPYPFELIQKQPRMTARAGYATMRAAPVATTNSVAMTDSFGVALLWSLAHCVGKPPLPGLCAAPTSRPPAPGGFHVATGHTRHRGCAFGRQDHGHRWTNRCVPSRCQDGALLRLVISPSNRYRTARLARSRF